MSLASSQASPAWTKPSPQAGSWHWVVQVPSSALAGPSSQASPGSVLPSPQNGAGAPVLVSGSPVLVIMTPPLPGSVIISRVLPALASSPLVEVVTSVVVGVAVVVASLVDVPGPPEVDNPLVLPVPPESPQPASATSSEHIHNPPRPNMPSMRSLVPHGCARRQAARCTAGRAAAQV
jgi:hypothetical protein